MGTGAVGIFDSGIGGLSVLQALRAVLPRQDFIYIADSGQAPYGERGDAHVLARSRALTACLIGRGIDALVVACNTATAAAIDSLRAEHPLLPIIGVEPALKPAAALSQTKRIGVMATQGTLASARFRRLLESLSPQADFVLQPCDGLAEAIERSIGRSHTTELIANCSRHTRAMGRFGLKPGEIDTLVLGCTHYPFAGTQLRDLLGPDVTLLDTGAPVARQTRLKLASLPGDQRGGGRVELFSTGDADALQTAAARWLHLDGRVRSLLV
ncbi:MAG: glutamate racemase [Polaromonas sp.]|nr:glutamate racemase [Polaromonas sp.]